MARKIKGYKPHNEREYIPKAFGNRSEKDPIRVWIKTPTERDKREVDGEDSVIRFSVGQDGSPAKDHNGDPIMELDNQESMRRHHRALERFVVRVENYESPAGPIATGKDLAEFGETVIVTDVFHEIMAATSLSEAESKNFKGSPAFSAAATQASGGTATSACAVATSDPATAPEAPKSSDI
jgi:hypothetical protein